MFFGVWTFCNRAVGFLEKGRFWRLRPFAIGAIEFLEIARIIMFWGVHLLQLVQLHFGVVKHARFPNQQT